MFTRVPFHNTIHFPNTIHTITEVIERPNHLPFRAENTPATRIDSPQIRGPGNVLGHYSQLTPAKKPLTAQKTHDIYNRCQIFAAMGTEAKIQSLITQMHSFLLPEETHRKIEKWISQFSVIKSHQVEDRSLSLATFIFSVLHPFLEKGSLEQQKQLLGWEDVCRDILQQMLPGESIENFLQECEIGMIEKKLLQKQCERADLLESAQRTALCHINREIDTQIETSCALIKQRLISLQNDRREMHETVRTEIDSITREVDQLGKQILSRATEIEKLGNQDNEESLRLDASLAECKKLLEGLT